MINFPIQTVKPIFIKQNNKKFIQSEIANEILSDKSEKYKIYRLFESWPTRIINGYLYRSYILMAYDPYTTDHDKKRWKKYQHQVIYGFRTIDFNNFRRNLPKDWIQDENQDLDDSLSSGQIPEPRAMVRSR